MGYPRFQRGPAAQLNSRGTVLHTQHPHQYTDYAKIAKRQRKPKVMQRPKPVKGRGFKPRVSAAQIMRPAISPCQRVQKPWIQTTVGWQQNPFK